MRTKLLRGAAGVLLAGAMTLATPVAALAATTPAAYSPDANITVGKTLTAAEAGIWPDTTAFTFDLEAVGYTAGPDPSSTGYTAYTKANMPMPALGTANTAAETNTDGALAEKVTVSPFTKPSGSTNETVSAKTGDATYAQAGVYTYEVRENVPATKEPGVTYDEATVYYVNVYVTNVLNEDGTPLLGTDGLPVVNVSNITLYEGANSSTDPAASTTVPEGAAKAAITTPAATDGTARNIAAAFVNSYTTTDLTVTKKVTGTMADVSKEFDFTLALTDSNAATDTRSYAYQVWSMGADGNKGGTDDKPVDGKSGTLTNGGTFQLKHDEYVVITGLPAGEKATVTETGATDYTTTITNQNGTTADAAVAAKTVGEKTLSTDNGAKNEQDFVNNKEAVSPTGVVLENLPFVLIASAAGVALFLVTRRRKDAAR